MYNKPNTLPMPETTLPDTETPHASDASPNVSQARKPGKIGKLLRCIGVPQTLGYIRGKVAPLMHRPSDWDAQIERGEQNPARGYYEALKSIRHGVNDSIVQLRDANNADVNSFSVCGTIDNLAKQAQQEYEKVSADQQLGYSTKLKLMHLLEDERQRAINLVRRHTWLCGSGRWLYGTYRLCAGTVKNVARLPWTLYGKAMRWTKRRAHGAAQMVGLTA